MMDALLDLLELAQFFGVPAIRADERLSTVKLAVDDHSMPIVFHIEFPMNDGPLCILAEPKPDCTCAGCVLLRGPCEMMIVAGLAQTDVATTIECVSPIPTVIAELVAAFCGCRNARLLVWTDHGDERGAFTISGVEFVLRCET